MLEAARRAGGRESGPRSIVRSNSMPSPGSPSNRSRVTLQASGDLDGAVALYERVAEQALERRSPLQAAASALRAAGQNARAEALWEDQLREHAWDSEAAIGLAKIRLERGQTDDRTVELAERAVLFRGGQRARDLLVEVHRARGEKSRAEALESAFAAGQPLPPTRITPVGGV